MKLSKNVYYVNYGSFINSYSVTIANAMAVELAHYGFIVSTQLLNAIYKLQPKNAMDVCAEILKDYTVGKLNPPLFKNWESREYFSFGEIVVQIFGYIVQLSGNDLADPHYMDGLIAKIELKDVVVVNLATKQEAKEKFFELAGSKVSLDRKNISLLAGLVEEFFAEVVFMDRIYSAEVRTLVAVELAKEHNLKDVLVVLKCAPADALRYAAALHDKDGIKLPADVIYGKLSWADRTSLLGFLNDFSYAVLFDATGINREAWKRFYNHIHLFSQKDFISRFPIIGLVARISMGVGITKVPKKYNTKAEQLIFEGIVDVTESGALAYRTFASRVQTAISSFNYVAIESLMESGGDYLLKNLATVGNGVLPEHNARFLNLVRRKLQYASAGVLWSLLTINIKAKYRIIDVKGNSVLEEANYPIIIGDIQYEIKRELNARYGFLGKVHVDNDVKDLAVPFLSKNCELGRGSKFKIDGKRYLYIFVHWIQNSKRTDLDLSSVGFDANWNATITYFGNQVNQFTTHSGDLTNAPAPNGATEYIRIDLHAIPKGMRHIVPIINVFCGEVFEECETAYAGFTVTDSPTFSIADEHVRYDLTEPANSNLPFVFDVKGQELMLLDFNNRLRNGATIHSELHNIKNIIDAVNTRTVITNGLLAEILSGPSDVVTKRIVKVAKSVGEIEPADLSSWFNEVK